MSENKQLKKPAATEADGVIAPCQERHSGLSNKIRPDR